MPEDKPKLRVLDLFSGIPLGGFSLGLERTGGFETVAFCEIEPFPRRVLAKHWPEVPIYDDVRTLTAGVLERDGIGVDVITGGFPCQDISVLGRRAGLEGERSGLWSEIIRLVRDLGPQFVLLENSASLCVRGLDRVCADLAASGYDAEWDGLPAAALGARHLRAREWVLAYPSGFGQRLQNKTIFAGRHPVEPSDWWQTEPDLDRVADGVPSQVDRHHCLGNAVVPQIPELIGRAILSSQDRSAA